jgi:hypothetical protein
MDPQRRTLVWAGAASAVAVVALLLILLLDGGETGQAVPSRTPDATEPSSPSASAPGSAPPSQAAPTTPPPEPPDPRQIPVQSLLRPGTSADQVLYGDMNGDGLDEIVLVSHDQTAPASGGPAQPFLDVFGFAGTRYQKVLDATTIAPPGGDHPLRVIDATNPEFNSQAVTFTGLVDFQAEGAKDLVTGVEVEGAGAGPLSVWVIGMDGASFVTDFFEQTTRGGTLLTVGDTVRLETGKFGPNDPGCCPSRISHQVIAFDPGRNEIRVVKETLTKNPGAA